MEINITSNLKSSPQTVWNWSISINGVNQEMSPLIKITGLGFFANLHEIKPGESYPITHSWLLLFGFIPIDRTSRTILEFKPESHFSETSWMLSMKEWKHERKVESIESGSKVIDLVQFEPRFMRSFSALFIKFIFKMRHQTLKKEFGS